MEAIEISLYHWYKLLTGLKLRAKGIQESGAFLLSNRNSKDVKSIAFYDTFDPTVSDSGIIQFEGGVKFYEFLAENNLEVLADIHTHPGKNTQQSVLDKTNPMIRLKGHIAIIAPDYCKSVFIKPRDCSVYKYLGEFKWHKFPKNKIPIHLKIL